jgi:group I intron endonuclease
MNNNYKDLLINVPIEVQMTYKDLSLDKTKDLIKLNTKDAQGIYMFKNEISNDLRDIYIGSSIKIDQRFNQHMKNINSNIYLQNAINKYGKQNFSFNILEWYEYDNELSKEDNGLLLIILEQKYLDLLKPNYNINPTAGKSRRGAKHTEESKELIRLANLNDNNPFYGKTHSDEYKEQLRKRMSGTNNPIAGKLVTEFVKQAIKDTFNLPVYLYDSDTKNLLNVYSSRKDFIKEHKVSSKTVVKYIKSGEIWRNKFIISSHILDK